MCVYGFGYILCVVYTHTVNRSIVKNKPALAELLSRRCAFKELSADGIRKQEIFVFLADVSWMGFMGFSDDSRKAII